MNTTPNAIGALSEIDRLGQAALDAIWAEEASYGPNREAVIAFMKSAEAENPDTAIAHMGQLLGVGEDISTVMRKSLEISQKGVERERAVNQYVMARRILTQAGLL